MGAADSKLAFRKSVFRLYEDKNISVTDSEFWAQFWNLPESADDIFSLIGANDIRRTRDTARENLEILIDKVLDKMQAILKAKNFPSEQYSINHLLNCCRILTRIMPFIFESPECMDWEESFFWTPRQVEKETKSSDNKPEYEILPCRGEFLLTLTIQALFLAGFTIPISLATKDSKVNYAIWENGVGSAIPISTYKDNEANRTEVLRLLAVLLSKSMYIPPQQLLSKEDLWLRYVAVKIERKIVLVILCSLLNTICNYDPTGWVPYNHVMVNAAGPNKEQLVSFCLTNLLVLLDYRSPHQADLLRQHDAQSPTTLESSVEVLTLDSPDAIPKTSVELEVFSPPALTSINNGSGASTAVAATAGSHQKVEENAFRHYMSKLHRKQDFEFLFNGIHRLLTNPMTAVNTYLPGSTKRVGCYVDVMMMCWRLIETNSRFTKYLIESDRVLDLTVDLIFHAIDNKDKLSQVGLVRMCSFILQTLSSNKDYSHKLNKSFTTHGSLPASIRLYAFSGTYADFLIISIFTLIASTQGKLSSLYPALILTISNISPYLTNLGITTVSKLMTLFHSMSSASFLLADEYNIQLTSYLLETFNNIVHYQFAENSNLVYSIVLHHDYFEKLDKLTFKDAAAEVERLKKLKEEVAAGATRVSVDTAAAVAAVGVESNDAITSAKITESPVAIQEPSATAAAMPKAEEEVKNDEDKSTEQQQDTETKQEEEAGVEKEEKIKEEEKEELKENASAEKQPLISEQPQQEEASSSSSIHQRHDSNTIPPALDTTEAPSSPTTLRTRSGFIPTESWMTFWKSKLPLSTILALTTYLVPQIEEKCKADQNISLEQLKEFLMTVQIKDALPAEEGDNNTWSIFIRKFQWGEALVIWFRSLMWGQNYVSSMKEYGAWNGTHVKLFQIKEE